MSKFLIKLVIVSTLVSLTACSGATKALNGTTKTVDGAFGYKLGEVFNPNPIINTSESSVNPCYNFTPEKPFENIQKYCIKTTPISNRIYSIEGNSVFNSYTECSHAEKLIAELIQNKYGKGESVFNIGKDGVIVSAMTITKDDKYIYVMSYHDEGLSGLHHLTVSYNDEGLKKLAQKESTENLLRGVDDSQF
ncbi:hypothetical protein [Trichloromonas sp.]|uniref:hypothetical protein n=1 Tax=Trichloromonas sp. TaxID=3069249 RepID=UPI003D816EB1